MGEILRKAHWSAVGNGVESSRLCNRHHRFCRPWCIDRLNEFRAKLYGDFHPVGGSNPRSDLSHERLNLVTVLGATRPHIALERSMTGEHIPLPVCQEFSDRNHGSGPRRKLARNNGL